MKTELTDVTSFLIRYVKLACYSAIAISLIFEVNIFISEFFTSRPSLTAGMIGTIVLIVVFIAEGLIPTTPPSKIQPPKAWSPEREVEDSHELCLYKFVSELNEIKNNLLDKVVIGHGTFKISDSEMCKYRDDAIEEGRDKFINLFTEAQLPLYSTSKTHYTTFKTHIRIIMELYNKKS